MDHSETNSGLAEVIERNIEALIQRRTREENNRNFQDRATDAITRFTGSMTCVYFHLVLFGAWIVINLGWLPIPKFDPSFVILAMVASVEAIFLSTFVLITQNRMARSADKRADLDLQISLLAEHEITQLIKLVREIAHQMGIQESQNPELHDLLRDIHPDKVMDTMEEAKNRVEKGAREET